MSGVENIEPFTDGFVSALCPELVLFAGLILLIIIPNLGKGTVRIPGTQTRECGCLAVIDSNFPVIQGFQHGLLPLLLVRLLFLLCCRSKTG